MKFNNKYHLIGNVAIGTNVRIGDRTIIYDCVEIGDNSIIANDCVKRISNLDTEQSGNDTVSLIKRYQ